MLGCVALCLRLRLRLRLSYLYLYLYYYLYYFVRLSYYYLVSHTCENSRCSLYDVIIYRVNVAVGLSSRFSRGAGGVNGGAARSAGYEDGCVGLGTWYRVPSL